MRLLLLFILLFPSISFAIDQNPMEFETPEQQERFWKLANELRCVVCQNQSVADSNAGIAQDVRDVVRDMILKGKTDDEIYEFLVERYSDYVLYNPPLKPKTYVLWIGPAILFFIALFGLLFAIRHHAKDTAKPETLTEEEQQKVQQALNNQ
ncbi:cytochrome c-type biogenesis protein [Candidatus Albibeggiatoa sp. nov. NOAA]|uniref:cytochrome c-type biogenesis protein n=1 Tax=Candidatus Albibeggiatoa sp. nov. NOAA TaxID=3162724 RepID=UPI0033029EF8|nr:cytochrome c-type biogenesis protein CcmH [Thiotrichaceae bacterium]